MISTVETVMSSTETWPLCLTLLSDTLLLHHSNPSSLPGKVRSVAKKLLDINISTGSSLSGRGCSPKKKKQKTSRYSKIGKLALVFLFFFCFFGFLKFPNANWHWFFFGIGFGQNSKLETGFLVKFFVFLA